MLELLQALPWPVVCGSALFVGHKHGLRYWEAKAEAKRVSDTSRLDKLETEIKALISAQNLKGLHR